MESKVKDGDFPAERPQTSRQPLPIDTLSPAVKSVLDHLAKARNYANDVQCDPWEFAVEIHRLTSLGATANDLRWLVKKGYILHAYEVTKVDDATRRFLFPKNLAFSERSCFLAALPETAPGLKIPNIDATDFSDSCGPRWDAEDRTLYVGSLVVKEYRVRSPNQEAVLAAFEEEGWPHYIDDPLSPAGEQSPKQRLRDTIKCLNANQKNRILRFRGDGTGERVRWELLDAIP
jgi:hypothetical protein